MFRMKNTKEDFIEAKEALLDLKCLILFHDEPITEFEAYLDDEEVPVRKLYYDSYIMLEVTL